jgi:flagellar M-ring protein FliF
VEVAGTKPSFLKQLNVIWNRLQPGQRATIVLFAVIGLAGLAALSYFMNQVDYVVGWRDLNPEDTLAIATKLKELNKKYHVSKDQTTIEVAGSTEEIDNLRIEIAASGLQRSGRIGYEIFDKNQFGMTDFTEQVNYKRALEGELGRTISSLNEVSDARVLLVLPKDSLFDEKKEEAKASVFVRLKNGRELSKSSIAGIVNLVAGAVAGLPTRNISVVDSEGRALSRVASGDGLRADVENGAQAQIEKDIVAKITGMLEPVVGKGKVHANASVELNFNSAEQTEETYNPTPPPVVLSQQKSEERVGGGAGAIGVPGTRSNDGSTAPMAAGANPDRMRQSELTNYEISKMMRHTILPKGEIKRMSVAVLIDHKTESKKGADGKSVVSFAPRSQEELNRYRTLVQTTIGYNETRGDAVTLENIQFFTEPALETDTTPLPWYVTYQGYLVMAMKYTAFLALFLLGYFLLVRPIRKKVFQSISSVAPALSQGPGGAKQLGDGKGKAQALPAGNAASAAQGGAPALPAPQNAPFIPSTLEYDIEQEMLREAEAAGAGTKKYEVLKRKVIEHANKDPEQVSQLVRSWIHEQA